YPNPFNPVTKIKFDLPKISDVIVKIYDVTGREIAKLINSKLQAGKYELTWNASQFSSGLYFIRIETNTFSDTKKMVLIK
ncbi:MAG: T9SS type A sorting domain-containing protein, partial [Ignavibacteriae bacterium]|nr:T9SS type A sorting domain-containing protein [Ignavibacteriota bacterium]